MNTNTNTIKLSANMTAAIVKLYQTQTRCESKGLTRKGWCPWVGERSDNGLKSCLALVRRGLAVRFDHYGNATNDTNALNFKLTDAGMQRGRLELEALEADTDANPSGEPMTDADQPSGMAPKCSTCDCHSLYLEDGRCPTCRQDADVTSTDAAAPMDTMVIAEQVDAHNDAGNAACEAGDVTLAKHHWDAARALSQLLMLRQGNRYYDPTTKTVALPDAEDADDSSSDPVSAPQTPVTATDDDGQPSAPDTTYNGYTNHATWLVCLWIDNDAVSQDYYREQAASFDHRYEVRDWLEDHFSEAAHATGVTNLLLDLLRSALSDVNWYEVAENLLAE